MENNKLYKILTLVLIIGFANSCKKKAGEDVYVIEPIKVKKNDGNKDKLLGDIEYISILYSDVFAKTITNNEVNIISNVTLSTGDKRAAFELLLQNFLNKSGTAIPTNSEMRQDVNAFVEETYIKFYSRIPNEFETYYFKDLIENNNDITPELIYFSFGTSDEYRFY